jgi:hypothetical protein
MKTLAEHFFLRPEFEKFALEPVANKRILIGEHDRKYRDVALNGLIEDASAGEGYKSVIFGDYGRGKTHEANNIQWEVERQKLPIVACYVKCHEYRAKEPFSSIFAPMIMALEPKRVNEVAEDYQRMVNRGAAVNIREIVGSDELATAFKALHSPNLDTVRVTMQWLGGETGIDTRVIGSGLSDSLSLSREFGAVLQGLAHMFKAVKKSVIVYLIDEAERFGLVTHTDTYWSWVGCLRALTELSSVGFVFYASAKTLDLLPNQLTWDEIHSRIGTQHYRELMSPGPDDLRQWIVELFQTVVRKGPVPPANVPAFQQPIDDTIPAELQKLVGSDSSALEAYPFTPAALSRFITDCVTQDLANRPREVLKRIQSAAKRANRLDQPTIDEAILDSIVTEV